MEIKVMPLVIPKYHQLTIEEYLELLRLETYVIVESEENADTNTRPTAATSEDKRQ